MELLAQLLYQGWSPTNPEISRTCKTGLLLEIISSSDPSVKCPYQYSRISAQEVDFSPTDPRAGERLQSGPSSSMVANMSQSNLSHPYISVFHAVWNNASWLWMTWLLSWGPAAIRYLWLVCCNWASFNRTCYQPEMRAGATIDVGMNLWFTEARTEEPATSGSWLIEIKDHQWGLTSNSCN